MSTLKTVLKSPLLYILGLSLLALSPLFRSGIWASSDLIFHIGRLAAFYQSLTEGNLVPRWAGNLYYGYGHPVLMMLYPLTNYLGSVFHFLGFSFTESVKLVFITSYLLSGLFAYLWLKDWLGKYPALLGTILFQFAPYRFVNLYVRAALGEHLAYVFIPLILWFTHRLSQKLSLKDFLLAVFSFAGLILSHNGASLIFLPVFAVYVFYFSLRYSSQKRNQLFKATLIFVILALCLTAFFWLPALVEGNQYTYRSKYFTQQAYVKGYLSLDQLIYSPWGYGGTASFQEPAGHTVMIGLIHWLVIFLTLGQILHRRQKTFHLRIFKSLLLIGFFITVFFMAKTSSFLLPYLAFILRFSQFPERLMTIALITSSLIGALLASDLKTKHQKKFVISFSLLAIILTIPYWQVNYWDNRHRYTDDYWLHQYFGTTDIGEYKPRWGSYLSPASSKIQVAEGEVIDINIDTWQSETHQYQLTAKTTSLIVDSTAYFPGWRVYVNGQKTPIEFQNPVWPGMITYSVDPGSHQVEVVFGQTKLRLIADFLSLASLICLLSIFIFAAQIGYKLKKRF